jgi:hypothetical protein
MKTKIPLEPNGKFQQHEDDTQSTSKFKVLPTATMRVIYILLTVKVEIRQRKKSQFDNAGNPDSSLADVRRTDFVALCVTPCISNKFRFCFPPNKGMNQFCKIFYFFSFVFFSSKVMALRKVL